MADDKLVTMLKSPFHITPQFDGYVGFRETGEVLAGVRGNAGG